MITKAEKLKRIWRRTHKDFKCKLPDGSKSIMIYCTGLGSCLVPLDRLTDEDIEKFKSYWKGE